MSTSRRELVNERLDQQHNPQNRTNGGLEGKNTTYTKINLERIINQPLKRRQRPNHRNPGRQPIPQSRKPNIPINPPNRLTRALPSLAISIQLAHHHIRRVRNNCTADPRDVAAQKGDSRLLQRVVGFLGLAEVGVDLRDSGLECREFDHGIRDLARPERVQTLVKPCIALLSHDFRPPLAQPVGVGRQRGLHTDFDGFERAEEDICDELGRRAGA